MQRDVKLILTKTPEELYFFIREMQVKDLANQECFGRILLMTRHHHLSSIH